VQLDIFLIALTVLSNIQLLLRNSGNTTPLIHAIRLGHKDVAIILLGTFSRWINHLEDGDLRKSSTITLLKALRQLIHPFASQTGLKKHRSQPEACDRRRVSSTSERPNLFLYADSHNE